jgi:hypothetical protein
MGDKFAIAADFWALAARLLSKKTERECHDEDGWELEIVDETLFTMTYHRDGGSASARIYMGDDGAGATADDYRAAIEKAAETLPDLAAKASPF